MKNSYLFLVTGFVTVSLSLPVLGQTNGDGTMIAPLIAPAQTTNVVPLSSAEQLGKDIFFDPTLSNPMGYSCATCHAPRTGFTGPSLTINQLTGPVPGVVAGRFGKRKPQSIPYTVFSPAGPYLSGGEGGTYVGGTFWDGRMPDLAAQATIPFIDQNEMANAPTGAFPPHAGGYSPLVAEKIQSGPYAALFQIVFGTNVFQMSSDEQVYDLMTQAISNYEASVEVNQFSSKYDASTNGTPARALYQFSVSEENGRQLFFGAAQCSQCHSAASLASVMQATQGKEPFTMYCYANIGVPPNPANPFYTQTNCDSDPEGCNPLGTNFIDYGLGANPNPAPDGTLFMSNSPGDIVTLRGLFKAPTLRNVDLRPSASFVKAYMHNGVFKSLEQVVHFYNKRNIATNADGDEVAFDLAIGPPDDYTPIFPPPEVIENVQNVDGLTPDEAAALSHPPDGDSGQQSVNIQLNGQIGNLELSDQEETDLVNFLKTLTDGYTDPNTGNVIGWLPFLTAIPSPRSSGSFLIQYTGPGGTVIVQTSTDLMNWSAVSTNSLAGASIITNTVIPGASMQFWRVVVTQ